MRLRLPVSVIFSVVCTLMAMAAGPASAQTAQRDIISDVLHGNGQATPPGGAESKPDAPASAAEPATVPKDPREGDLNYEQAKKFMAAIDGILKDTADTRTGAAKLPSRDDYIVPPLWTETREDRNAKVRDLLDSALAIVTDVPVVEVQKKVEGLRKNIRNLEDQISKLKEKQLVAPKDATLPGILNDTVA